MTDTGRDDEGHLTFRADGAAMLGLCHCARNEAHAGDPAQAHAIIPIYADGPLQGAAVPVDDHLLRNGLRWPDDQNSVLIYRFHRFALLGRIIWVGSVRSLGWNDADLFDVIASDRAKRASTAAP
jgi:hypothetical protein